MRIAIFVSAAALLAVAGAQASPGRGTLMGVVKRGPIAPVCVAEQPCDAPARGVTLIFSRNGTVAGRAVTGDAGRYRIRLPAGSYAVRRARAAGVDRNLAPNRVRVEPGRAIRVDFSIDTGIR